MNKKKFKSKKSINFFDEGAPLDIAKSAPKMDVLQGVMGAVGGVASLAGSAINNLKIPELNAKIVSANNNDDLMSQWGNYSSQKLEKTDLLSSTLSGVGTGASAGMALGPWGAAAGAVIGGLSNLITGDIGNKKKAAKEVEVDNQQLRNFEAKATGINQQNLDMNLANYSKFGGNLMADGGFTNDVTSFNVGGTHEQNPNQGVPQGIGQNGKPNLVEEGEVKYKDYIYSNRLSPSIKLLEDTRLDKKYAGKTFGEIAKLIQKESEERPNDPISKNGLNDTMDKLKQAQEVIKLKKQQRQQNAMQMEMLKQGIDPNTLMQQPQQMANGGILPQGIEPNMEQMMQQIAGWIQQGMSPQQVVRQLVTSGIPIQQAQQLVQQVSQKISQQGQQGQQGQQEQAPQMMAFGGNMFKEGNYLSTPRVGVNVSKGFDPSILLGASDPITNENTFDSLNPGKILETRKLSPIQTAINDDASRVTYGQNISDDSSVSKEFPFDALRYAPAVGSGIMALTDMVGLTNKSDYTAANTIGAMKVKGERLGNYMAYKPMDRDYYQNKLNANAGATRAGLANSSGGNRATYAASLLGADYNYGENMGNLAQKAEEYNLAQKQKIEEFNRGTNQFNATQSNWEQGINTELATKSALLRADAKNNSSAAKAANLNNFLDNLGGVGKEEAAFNMIKNNPALYYEMTHNFKTKYKGNNKKKNGGQLKKKGIDYGII